MARDYQLHLIIALPVIWFIVFKYLPMYGAQIAFRDFAAAKGIWGSPWVGLDHFKRFFESYLFWRIVGNTFFLSIYTLAATFPIPILLALSINNANNRMFRKAVQMIIYAPYFISTVVMVGLLIKAKFTLLLNSGSELPDMMMGMQISNDEKHLYGSQGLFIPLNDIIAEHGFYINDVVKAAPNFLKESAGPDGNVYVLTAYEECYHCGVAQKMWINQVWLDKLGMEIPTTTEELREVLRAFKTQDPNGNGVADELALSGFANSWHTRPWPYLLNAFVYTDDSNMLNVQDGEIVAAFVQPEWREGMRYVHSLFAEGLIDEEMFVRDRSSLAPLVEGDPPRLGAGTVGHRGMLGAWRGGYEGGSGDFRVVPPLTGPDGHASAGYFPFGPKEADSAAITQDADNPEAIYKWLDFMYSREASVRNWWGVFGVDWRWAEPGEIGINGKPAVHTNLGADAVFLEPQQTQAWIHSSPFFMPSDLFGGSSGDPDEFNYEGFLIDSSHVYYEHIPEVWVPRMALDVENAKTVSEIRPVVNDFVYESAAKFVTGRLDINDDNDWNTYLAELDKIGLPQYLEIMNATYESYK